MQETEPLVSIIVPVYGTEDYLPACIDSICNQTYPNIQIVLVDDQSPDACPEICDNYAQKDNRIIVIHQENKGVSGARNTGIRQAIGKYIMFVDSDDELYPDAVKILIQDAAAYGADVVSGDQFIPRKNNQSICTGTDAGYSIFTEDQPLLLSLSGDDNTTSACAKLFRFDFIKDIFFEEGKNINEDGFFVFKCYLRKPILVRHRVPVYQYNTRLNSTSRQLFSEEFLAMFYFCEQKKELIARNYPQYIEQAYNMEVRTNLQMLQLLFRTNDRQYRTLQQQCIKTVRRLYRYHRPVNRSHKRLAWVVRYGQYPLYKFAVRLKYYRCP